MHIRRHVSFVVTLIMALLFCLPMAHASDTSANVRSAPLTYNSNARSGMVRVYLSSLGQPTSLDITIAGSYSVSGNQTFVLNGGETVKIQFNTYNGDITLIRAGQSYNMGQEMVFRRHQTNGSNGLKIAQARKPANLYPGDLQLKAQQSSGGYRLYPIVHVYIEPYLYGVVPYEMGSSAHIEALKAQAIAARTYTLDKMNTRASQLYDVVDTTNDQVYYGQSGTADNCTAAVDATKGIVLMNGGALTRTYYTASNGGQTEAGRVLTSSAGLDYLKVKDDPFDLMNSAAVVRKLTVYSNNQSSAQNSNLKNILHQKAVQTLSSMGYSTDSVQVERITSVTPHTPQYASPSRLYTRMDFGLSVSTRSGSVNITVTCDIFGELESALGMSINATKNELWSASGDGINFIIEVRRYGHGVGMSQRGAMQMGSLGYTYDQILGFYYEGSERMQYTFTHTILSAIGTGDSTITNTEPPADITPSGQNAATVKLAGLDDTLPIRYAADVQGKVLTTVHNGGMVTVLARGDAWTLVQYGRIVGYVPTSSLKLSAGMPTSSDKQPTNISQWATVTASGSLNMRAGGSMNAQVIAQIPSGATLCVFDVSTGWAQVQYGAQAGYASTDFLQISNSFPGKISITSAVATVKIPSGSGSVNMRSTASTTGGIVTTVPHGQTVQVILNDGSWCQASYGSYQGYIMSSYLDFGQGSIDNAPEINAPGLNGGEMEAVVKTASTSLNLRAQASVQSAVLASIPRGESIIVTSRGGEWSAVRYGTLQGYVMTQYLSFPNDQVQQITGYATVNTSSGSLNMRSQPKAGSAIITSLPRGSRIGVIEWGETWSHVSYEGKTGYVMSSYLLREGQSEGAEPSIGSAVVNTESGSLNLRQSPYSTALVLASIPKGTSIDVLSHGSEWTQVRWGSISGYVMTRYLSFDTGAAVTKAYVATSGSNLNLRETASAWARVLTTIPNGSAIEVLEKGAEWSRVRWQETTGYVMNDYLTFGSSPQTSTKAWIVTGITGGVNLRQNASYSAAVLTTLSPGTQITVTGTEGEWCAVTWSNFSGYIHQDYITRTEPAPAEIIRYVSTTSGGLNLRETASSDARILLSIPRGESVIVIENTGSWSEVRYGGYTGYVMTQYLSSSKPETQTVTAPPASNAVYDATLVNVPNWHALINATTALNIRQWCATDAPILTSIAAGTQVDLLQVGDTWCHIRYEGVDGYCMTNYLTLQPSMP